MAKINIRPGVSMLSTLSAMNYRTWFALGEFVDNAVQSYLSNKNLIKNTDRKTKKLKVTIEIDLDADVIRVIDNAAGIALKDFQRAFRPAEIPLDRTGLNEFGMGMKAAACWFSQHWTVRTKSLGDTVSRTIQFDVRRIVSEQIEDLDIKETKAQRNEHYTIIELRKLNYKPQKKNLQKIKDHLSSIYREFLRDGLLELWIGKDQLEYKDPVILKAPYFREAKGKPKVWKKEISFSLGNGKSVKGFAALRDIASTSEAGFALFRRGRLIQGSRDESYRPEIIFGKSNSYTYQRLFGEFHLVGFQVSHTKDGFNWEGKEDDFLERLQNELNKGVLPLLSQAEGHRKRLKSEDLKGPAQQAADNTAEIIEREAPYIIDELREDTTEKNVDESLSKTQSVPISRQITIGLDDAIWEIELELASEPGLDWLDIGDYLIKTNGRNTIKNKNRRIGIRLNLAHPFMEQFAGTDLKIIEPIVRIASALAISEVIARESGAHSQTEIRKNVNELLRGALSKTK